MGTLTIDFRILDDFENCASKVLTSLNEHLGDYSGVKQGVERVSTPRDNLDQCNYYLKKKEQILKDKAETLSGFKGKVSTFVNDAEQADKRVAEHVHESTDTFRELAGIPAARGGALAALGEVLGNWWDKHGEPFLSDIVEGVRGVYDAVKAFYEKNKYIIDAVVNSVLLAAAVVGLMAATGGVGVFFAGFAAYEALISTSSSWAAVICDVNGDQEGAERCSNVDGRDFFRLAGKGMDTLFGTEVFETGANMLYSGLSIGAAVYSIGKTGKDLFGAFDFKNQGIKTLMDKKAWGGALKTLFGIDETPSQSNVDDVKKIVKITSNLGVSEKTAEMLLYGTTIVNNVETVVETVDNTVTAGYQRGNEQVVTLLGNTSIGSDAIEVADSIKKYRGKDE